MDFLISNFSSIVSSISEGLLFNLSHLFILADFWLWKFMGRLHPLIVHFPIGLLFVALLLELLTINKKYRELRPAVNLVLSLGTLSAILAVILGWLLEEQDQYSGDVLNFHKWFGIATAILALVTVLYLWFINRNNRWDLLKSYRAVFIFTILSLTITGHFGASLTHGSDFLTSVLPLNNNKYFPRNPDFDITRLNQGAVRQVLNESQVADLNLEVRSIFAHNCYKCHSSEKEEGELRLDKKDFVMKGGESGDVISPGHPENSEMLRRLTLSRDDEESMPPKGKTLSEAEIATIEFWIKAGAPWPDSADFQSVFKVASLEPRFPEMPPAPKELHNPIDRFVNTYFEENKISWPEVVNDRVFIRRVYLDIIGLLPPPYVIDKFISDKNFQKRAKLVNELLSRKDDYAQHWLSFWNDALRNDYSGTGYITKGRFSIKYWLYDALERNKLYDLFVKELISPDERSEGFIKGIQWRGTVNASQRTEMQAAQNVAQVFLGLNLKCASCHDSFISNWKLKDAYAFANIFADTTLEVSRCDIPTGELAGTKIIFTELGEIDSTLNSKEKLKELSQFLTAPKNGRLYRTLVNRIWAQLMGRGIIAPVDLMDNEPWSQDLLDWLASDFAKSGKDLKRLIFNITTSRTYQLPSVKIKDENDLLAEDYSFKGMHRRRISAEQFADAVSTIIHPIYSDTLNEFNLTAKANPEKSGYLTSEEIFGKNYTANTIRNYSRASLVKNDVFLTALGRPNRENVSTSRSSQANLLQALELTNGQIFNNALKSGAKVWKEKYSSNQEIITELYRKALGRYPEEAEVNVALEILGTSPQEEAIQDLLWAIMLLPEFQLIY
ncbi:hypothetical protein BH23BAC1_BH23BAC1_06980 [soil metagenome]